MKKYLLIGSMLFLLSSCVVSAVGKVASTAVKATVGIVKGTVKGVSWAVSKAEGEISEKRIDGTWKVVGVYNGTYEEFIKDGDADNQFENHCGNEDVEITFKTNRSRFQPFHCSNEKEDWVKYKFKFGKNPQTKEKENHLRYGNNQTISIIDVTSKTMVIESEQTFGNSFPKRRMYLLEQ
ncbi:MAG: hypothetical protein WDA08_05655 [Weeksellaceae bacterium]